MEEWRSGGAPGADGPDVGVCLEQDAAAPLPPAHQARVGPSWVRLGIQAGLWDTSFGFLTTPNILKGGGNRRQEG